MKRFLNPSMFAVAVLCFFLPFMNIQCNGTKILTVSGVQMATGANVNPSGGGMFDRTIQEKSSTSSDRKMFEVLLLLALIVLLGGCITTLVLTLKNKPELQQTKAALAFSIGALVCLFIELISLSSKMGDINKESGSDMVNLSWHLDVGYWLVILISVGLIVYNARLLKTLNTPAPEAMFDNYVPPTPPTESV